MNGKMKEMGYGRVFWICILTAALIFIPAIIYDKGYFIFLGDFNSQQIPFYKTAHAAVRSGNFGWNWYTDLGVSFIGSYSFYLLGSPFFWLTIPFPNDWVPYLMGPLLILKFGCAGVTSFAWLKRHVKTKEYAAIGALLYAFSGYSIYNIFFNHFHDAMVFFPLLLIGIDELMEHGTRGVFAVAVCMNAVVSYFFFVGEVVFVLIYFVVRALMKGYVFQWKRFGFAAVEAVLGLLMSMFLFLPSLAVMLSNSRVDNYAMGHDIWVYSNRLRVPAILASFFIPNDLPSKPVFFPDSNVKWTSLSAYMPLFGMSGVIAYMQSRKKRWLKTLIIILMVMACVPILNSSFTAFNKSYYARWFYMLILMMSLATIKVLDEGHAKGLEKGAVITLLITAVIILIIGLTPQKNDEGMQLGLYDSESLVQYAIQAITALVSIGAVLLLSELLIKNPKLFAVRSLVCICILAVLYGNFYIVWGKSRSYDTHEYMIPDVLEGGVELKDDDRFYRIDTDDSIINLSMFFEIPTIRAFHSLVPASIMEFYEYVGEKRDVNSKPSYENYALRSLFSVRYFLDANDAGNHFQTSSETEDSIIYDNQMPGYILVDEQSDYKIYENIYYIPIGFTYDTYVTYEQVETVDEKDRAVLMLDSLILTEEQGKKYDHLLEHTEDVYSIATSEMAYNQYCEERAATAASSFSWDASGFQSTIYSEKATLLFFSVPFEEGWAAQVNGEPVEIEKVNTGFMAVPIEAGSSNVIFTYETPGLKLGCLIAGGALGIFVSYLAVSFVMSRKGGRK